MAPKKKKSGPSIHPSTLKALPPAATSASEASEASEDVNAAGGVTGAGGAVTAPPAADTGAGDVGGEQHQQRPGGHIPQGAGEGVTPSAPSPPTDGHSRSNGARSGANHRPPTAPTTGATMARVSPPGRADQTNVLNGAADPRAPPSRDPAAQVVVP
nr:forkhead box protein L2-like [Aegilops tauschii subsp. strangulata]